VKNGFTLIITLDLGIKASAVVKQANFSGIDFIICDHHLPDEAVPQAIAVLDPKQHDCRYPFKELTGCGLGFKLIQAFSQRHLVNADIYQYLDLVAVSIASDIVPINGENRVLAYFGLKKLNEDPSPGLKALKEIAGIKNELDISGIVFTLGPRINSAGRVAHAKTAVELLTSLTENEALIFAEKLNTKNDLRRSFDLTTTEEALAMIEESPSLQSKKSTVLFKPTWHKGVIGIVAARCVEKYYRPTVILTESNEKITGSARSIPEFDLYEALLKCSDLFEKFGGHKHAAGLTLDKKNLSEFEKRFETSVSEMLTDDILIPKIEIDQVLNFNSITAKFVNVLKQFAPFGPENQKPFFESKNVFIANGLSNIKEKHVKFLAGQEGSHMFFKAIGFDMLEYFDQLKTKECFNIVYTIEENSFNDQISIQLRLKDIKFDV
jgi:single-stranded-DNA-specific exonuclease